MKYQKIRKTLSFIASFSLVFQTFLPLTIAMPAYAEESTPSAETTAEPTATPTIEPTAEPTSEPTPEITVTPEITPASSSTAESTPAILSTEEFEASQEADVISEVTSEATPTEEVTEEPQNNSPPAETQNQPTVTTDKADYAPSDTVQVAGMFFLANTPYVSTITSEDAGGYSNSTDIITDPTGAFFYLNPLDGTPRLNYSLEVVDVEQNVVATTTFTDTAPSTVRICHSTSSDSNPYNEENPAKSADVGAHDGHNGGIYPTSPWGDIIPQFDYQVWEKTGSHQEINVQAHYTCSSGEHLGTGGNSNKCYHNGNNAYVGLATLVPATYKTVDDYGWVTHTYTGKNWPAGESIWDAGCEVPLACGATKTIEKSNYFSGTEVQIDFDNSHNKATVTAKSGYSLVSIFYDYSGDWENELDDSWSVATNPAIIIASGDITDVRVVVKKVCAVDCSYHYSACSTTCGTGTQSLVIDTPASNGGTACPTDTSLICSDYTSCVEAQSCPNTCGYAGSSDSIPDGRGGYKVCPATEACLIPPTVTIDPDFSRIIDGKACGIGSAWSDDGIKAVITNWKNGYILQGRYFVAGGSYGGWVDLTDGLWGTGRQVLVDDTLTYTLMNTGDSPAGSAGWQIRVLDSSSQEFTPPALDSLNYIITNDLTSDACGNQAVCNDGKITSPEECDGELGVGEHQSCSNGCKLVNLPYCGDGLKNGEEQCDGTSGIDEGNNFCSTSCHLVPIYKGGSICSDGKVKGMSVYSSTIPANSATGVTLNLSKDKEYLFEASRTFIPTSAEGYLSDAGFTWVNGNLSGSYGINGTPPDLGAHALLGDLGLGVGIINWGVNNLDHKYSFAYPPTNSSQQFVIGDRWGDWFNTDWQNQAGVGDNTGSLKLDVYECVQPPVKIVATKVVCDSEQYLPNNTQGTITATTAEDFVKRSEGKCHIEEDWNFQWALTGGSFGEFQTNTSALGEPWTTFSGTTEVPSANVGSKIEVREVFPNNTYVPFSNSQNNVSAEIYCTGDSANYDNWEWLNNPQAGQTFYCVAFNAPNYGSVSGYKWNDVNGNTERCDYVGEERNLVCEEKLAGWTIFIDKNEDGLLDKNEVSTSTDASNGYHFSNLTPGNYSICEVEQGGWTRSYPTQSNCQSVTITAGNDTGDINFGNHQVAARLLISRSNNSAPFLTPGSAVEHTITIKVEDNDVDNLTLTDLLPKGFIFRPGSYSVLNGSTPVILANTPEYHSPGVWSLGNYRAGDTITIKYLADISSDVEPGVYPDLASATANDAYDQGLTFTAIGDIADTFTGTNVEIVKDQTSGGTYDVEKKVEAEGQVLGASTSLPATGASPMWLMLALVSLVYGIRLVKSSNKSK